MRRFNHRVQRIAFNTAAAPVSRWHQWQWQQLTNIGRRTSRYRTSPQAQLPSAQNSRSPGMMGVVYSHRRRMIHQSEGQVDARFDRLFCAR